MKKTALVVLVAAAYAGAAGACADEPGVVASKRLPVGPPVATPGPSRVVAFTTSQGDGPFDISVVSVGGGRARVLARGPDGLTNPGFSKPAWSPDGRRLAVMRLLTHGNADPPDLTTVIVLLRADGSHPRRVIGTAMPGENDGSAPTWSPDGRYLAFAGGFGRRVGLFVVDWRTGHRVQLISGGVSAPAWSPDGSRIAFNSSGLSVLDLRTRRVKRLIKDGHGPAWSPDSKRLAFASSRDKNGESCFESGCGPNDDLYISNADATAQKRLTRTRFEESQPAWSPDGQRIAFATDRFDNRSSEGSIGVINRDGSCYRALSRRAHDLLIQGGGPAWQPGRLARPDLVRCAR